VKVAYSEDFEILGFMEDEKFFEHINLKIVEMIEKELRKITTMYNGVNAEIKRYDEECEVNVIHGF